jgi:phosphatidylglycerophosphate synthase
MHDLKTHSRVNNIFLGPIERPVLRWLAAHMPAWMNPDILTSIGLFGAVVIFISYALTTFHPGFLWLANLGFLINWFGDSLDGTLARYRDQERPRYGFFIDHTLDSISESLIFIGLGLSPYLQLEIALFALCGYLLMSIHVYIRTAVSGIFQISYAGLGPTEVRLIGVLTNIATYYSGNIMFFTPFGPASLYDLVGVTVSVLLLLIFLSSTVVQAKELARMGE